MAKQSCLERLEVDGERSVLDEQRTRGGAARWDDFPTRYRAAYLDPDSQDPVEAVKGFEIGDTPYLWFSSDFAEAVVNAAVLTDLSLVDVTGLEPGKRARVGSFTELGLGLVDRRAFVRFLMRADVLRTYQHIGSKVCIVSERDDDSGYAAKITGEHTYFTNEEHVEAFAFEVEIEPGGAIWVEGVSPQ